MYYTVPFLIPYSVGHLIWTWCYLIPSPSVPFVPQTNPNAHFTGDGLYWYTPCPRGQQWTPSDCVSTSCISCYCLNGYVSQCFLKCSSSTPATSTSPSSPITSSVNIVTATDVTMDAIKQDSIKTSLSPSGRNGESLEKTKISENHRGNGENIPERRLDEFLFYEPQGKKF